MSSIDSLLSFIESELVDLDPGEKLSVDDDLLVSGRVDSLGLMRLIAFINEELGREVPYGDIVIGNFSSVARIGAYLASTDLSGLSSESDRA